MPWLTKDDASSDERAVPEIIAPSIAAFIMDCMSSSAPQLQSFLLPIAREMPSAKAERMMLITAKFRAREYMGEVGERSMDIVCRGMKINI